MSDGFSNGLDRTIDLLTPRPGEKRAAPTLRLLHSTNGMIAFLPLGYSVNVL